MNRLTSATLALLAVGTTCTPGPEFRTPLADDRDRLVAHMGRMDARLLEVQRAAGDPIEAGAIRLHLAALGRELDLAASLGVSGDDFAWSARRAAGRIRTLEAATWTPESRDDHYATLRSVCSGCHAALAPPAPEAAVQGPDSWQSCGRCHERVYSEWKETLHAQAWRDPVYRMSAGNPPKVECRGCHAMEPILEREISAEASYRPRLRADRRDEGVHCLACHGLPGGSVAAGRDVPDAPCRPRRDARLLSPVFCGACHNPSHLAYDEWKTSACGKSCTDCHARREGRFTHRMLGVDDPEFLRTSVSLTCSVAEERLSIQVTNRSGHRLPAEVPSRVLRLQIRIGGESEEILFRRPAKLSVGLKDNRLLPDETRRFDRELRGTRPARVEVYYQQSPLVPQEGWARLADWELR